MRSAVALSLFAVCPVLAQGPNNVVPATMNNVEGGSGSIIPFGLNQPVRYMCIYDAEELPWSGPRVIQRISLRADNSVPGTTAFPSNGNYTIDLTVSTTTVKAENASTTFDANYGEDFYKVIVQQPIMLAAQPAMPGVRPATIDLVFNTPWVYGLTPVRHGGEMPTSFLFDLQIYPPVPQLPTGTSYRVDNLGSCSGQPTPFGNLGPNCLANRAGGAPGNPVLIAADLSMIAGANYNYTITGLPPSAVFALSLALTSQGQIFGQPLPYALFDPANPNLPPPGSPFRFSAPDCWLNVDFGSNVFGAGDLTGLGHVSLALAPGRRFVGMSLFAQAAVLDPTANQLLIATSSGLSSTVCGPLGVARIYASGNALATTGQFSLGQGAIIEVQ